MQLSYYRKRTCICIERGKLTAACTSWASRHQLVARCTHTLISSIYRSTKEFTSQRPCTAQCHRWNLTKDKNKMKVLICRHFLIQSYPDNGGIRPTHSVNWCQYQTRIFTTTTLNQLYLEPNLYFSSVSYALKALIRASNSSLFSYYPFFMCHKEK